ncbi:M23 family metallopeptidase [uncultured Psychroserpens sp.]|uniref:M23 family metallopeptidase n=1 Tax=uncultured Psychroserpens sp. TaxID=255436 RepID=UPI00260C6932|nr:M23 family metallopeptidase [uncultured Psychroserpens sp.]
MKTLSLFSIFIILSSYSYGQKTKDEPVSYEDEISLYWNKKNDTLKLFVKNKLLVPIEVILRERATNNESSSILVKPKDSTVLTFCSGKIPDSICKKQFNDSLRIGYYYGHKSLIKPELDYLYRLPFKKGKKYSVSQGFNGKSTHKSIASKYAIDFQLEIGELVFAAREGLVVQVIDWFTKYGGKSFMKKANKIVIMHDDGTIASYVHLDYKGSFVKVGDRVSKGQKIGVSGLTGFTSGPHLHFVVRKERDIAIPIYFEGYENQELKRRRRYKVKN